MPNPDRLALIDKASTMLAQAKTIPEAKEILSQAAALERYFKSKRAEIESASAAELHAAEIKACAERKLGELVRPQNGRDRRGGTSKLHDGTSKHGGAASLPAGITKTESHRWQAIASIPADVFEKQISTAKTELDRRSLTTAAQCYAMELWPPVPSSRAPTLLSWPANV
jgi:hypothetical protein